MTPNNGAMAGGYTVTVAAAASQTLPADISSATLCDTAATVTSVSGSVAILTVGAATQPCSSGSVLLGAGGGAVYVLPASFTYNPRMLIFLSSLPSQSLTV